MERKIITTADGSKTIHIPEWNEQYHSKHGAIQEAKHVFIKYGLYYFCHSRKREQSESPLSILEIGFGTGLNAFITFLEADQLGMNINYVGVEAYPVSMDEINRLHYPEQLSAQNKEAVFIKMHKLPWEEKNMLNSNFHLTKQQKYFKDITETNQYDLIYFDAFGARVQPELWTKSIFEIMYEALKNKGILVTYSAKGSVRRAMQATGFEVERLPGPPGKREMLRAFKQM